MRKLTDKELAVVNLMLIGMTPAEIMAALDISRDAYKKRRESLMNKLGATNNTQIGMMVERRRRVQTEMLQ